MTSNFEKGPRHCSITPVPLCPKVYLCASGRRVHKYLILCRKFLFQHFQSNVDDVTSVFPMGFAPFDLPLHFL